MIRREGPVQLVSAHVVGGFDICWKTCSTVLNSIW